MAPSRSSKRPADVPTVHLVTSSGGHIDLLHAVKDAFAGYRRVWVAQPSLRAEAIAAAGEEVRVLPRYDRHPTRGNHHLNIARAARLVRRERPRLVVTPGAGAAVPFCVFARLSGARIVFVETMARVTGPSASGRVLSRLAAASLVQWPEAMASYPRPRLCRPALLDAVSPRAKENGRGTFVGVGTHSQQFDRLLAMVDDALEQGLLPEPVIAQGGVSGYRPRNYVLRDWLAPDAVEETIRAAEHVVCHGGSGLVAAALRAGIRPLVLPRLTAHGEHFDDHQTQIVEKLGGLGLARPLGERITAEDIRAAKAPLPSRDTLGSFPSVKDALRSELDALLGSSAGPDQGADPAVDGGRPDRMEVFSVR